MPTANPGHPTMGDISIQHGCPDLSLGWMTSNWTSSVTVRRSVKRPEITTRETRTGDHALSFEHQDHQTNLSSTRPSVTHVPSTNGMTPDDLHLGDLQSPTMPPANSFDRPVSPRPWAGGGPGHANNSTHSTMTPPALALPRSCRGVEPIKSNLFPFPLPLYKKARHIKRISQRQAKSRKFFRISIFRLKCAKNVPKRTKSCHVDFVQTDTGGLRKKGPVSRPLQT